MTNNTVGPIYNEFNYDKFTMNSILTNNTVGPIYNQFIYEKGYSLSVYNEISSDYQYSWS